MIFAVSSDWVQVLDRLWRRPWFLSLFVLTGCDCACRSLPCPRPAPGQASGLRGEVSFKGTRILESGTDPASPDVLEAEVCIQFPGDAAKPSGWDGWSQKDKIQNLGFNALPAGQSSETDRLIPYMFKDDDCNTIDGPEFSFSNKVLQSWTGSVDWKAGTYDISSKWDDDGSQILDPNDDDPDDDLIPDGCTATNDGSLELKVKLHFYQIGPIEGPSSLERGKSDTWTVKLDGVPGERTIEWKSSVSAETSDQESWGGIIVKNTGLTCKVTFTCGIVPKAGGGVERNREITDSAFAGVSLTPRDWGRATPENAPKRYPPEDTQEMRTALPELFTNLCSSPPGDAHTVGLAFQYPAPEARGLGIAASLTRKEVDSGPNKGIWYNESKGSAKLEVDTNVHAWFYSGGGFGTDYDDFQANSDIGCAAREVEGHEEGHFDFAVQEYAGLPDIIASAEGETGGGEIELLANSAATMAVGIIGWHKKTEDRGEPADNLASCRLACSPPAP